MKTAQFQEVAVNCRACPVCGTEDAPFRIEAHPDRLGRGLPRPPVNYAYHMCMVCEATFISQLPEAEHLRMYYESDVYHLDSPPTTAVLPPKQGLSWFRRLHLSVARPLAGPPGRLLDFGCGPGDFMAYARCLGWQSTGVEYSQQSAAAARSRGFEVILEPEVPDLPDGAFDLISMVHSLEHVPDPRATFRTLITKLRRGGVLFVEVPYLDCHEFWMFGRYYSMVQAPVHLQFFTDHTMQWLADDADVKLIRCRDNLWTPGHFLWSMLNVMEETTGPVIGRRWKCMLNAAAFPAVLIPAAAASWLGMKAVARQYWFFNH